MSDRVIDPTRQGAETHEPDLQVLEAPDQTDRYSSPPLTLEHTLSLMNAWRDDVECWGLHQMCRVLREAWKDERQAHSLYPDVIHEIRRIAKEATGGNCTFVDDDVRLLAGLAQRAVLAGLAGDATVFMQKRLTEVAEAFREGHEKALGEAITPVFYQRALAEGFEAKAAEIQQKLDDVREWWHAARKDRDDAYALIASMTKMYDKLLAEHLDLQRACNRTRGEPFPTDYLPDEGWVHIFEPPVKGMEYAPRKSVGCVRLIEPT